MDALFNANGAQNVAKPVFYVSAKKVSPKSRTAVEKRGESILILQSTPHASHYVSIWGWHSTS